MYEEICKCHFEKALIKIQSIITIWIDKTCILFEASLFSQRFIWQSEKIFMAIRILNDYP